MPLTANHGTRARSSVRRLRSSSRTSGRFESVFRWRTDVRELALFNLGIDSKLRGCDLVALKVRDVCHGDQVASPAVVMQHKTQRPVQFEITPVARGAVQTWIKIAGLKSDSFLFPSRMHDSPHLGTRQYARILEGWVEELGLDNG
jgi:site-specific recombinase XerC